MIGRLEGNRSVVNGEIYSWRSNYKFGTWNFCPVPQATLNLEPVT
jgi:hypothetical protein